MMLSSFSIITISYTSDDNLHFYVHLYIYGQNKNVEMHEINWKHLRLYSYQYLPFTALDNVTTQKHECKIDSLQHKKSTNKKTPKRKT